MNSLKYFMFFSIIAILSLFSAYADSNGIWIDAKDVRSGTFASDEGGGNFIFPDSVEISNKAIIEGNENSLQLVGNDHSYVEFYPQGKSSGREGWLGFGTAGDTEFTIQDPSNILLNPFGGNVGIGTQNPSTKLDTRGDIKGYDIYSNGELVATRNWVLSQDYASKTWVNNNDDVNDADSDPTNEIQNLNEVLNQGQNAGGIRIDNVGNANSNDDVARWGQIKNWVNNNDDVNDADNDPTNEIQNLNSVLTQGNWAGDRIRGVSNPQNGRDSANKRYVDNNVNSFNIYQKSDYGSLGTSVQCNSGDKVVSCSTDYVQSTAFPTSQDSCGSASSNRETSYGVYAVCISK